MVTVSQKDSSPTPGAFRLFLNWLDEGVESNGQKYLEMRRRLVHYFDRKNCLSPDDLADETLSRVARRLAEESEIRGVTPAHYCYRVARFVFLEYQRHPVSKQVSIQALPLLEDALPGTPPISESDAREAEARRLGCLESCLRKLPSEHQELILEYYHGERGAKIDHRRTLASRLGLTSNALSIRACRIREKLETCVKACCGGS
jgi:DNA-directed RNA polymerase specialized sigma24 family protein